MSGANQDEPELRAGSLKSALRAWYRAADPRAILADRKHEARREDLFFGGAGDQKHGMAGQSPLLLRLSFDRLREFQWEDPKVNRFTEGQGKHARNGLRYLGYSLQLGEHKSRRAIAPGEKARLTLVEPRGRSKKLDVTTNRRAWLSALWLLANLGSLGSRSRRGLGSVEITNWSSMALATDWREDAALLPDVQRAKGLKEWYAGFSSGMGTIEGWFGTFEPYEVRLGRRFGHPHLGKKMTLALLGAGHRDWMEALNDAGRRLQDFRVRRAPDYADVKGALETGKPLRTTPERATFGLPLSFRYSSLPAAGTAQFVPSSDGREVRERHASLLRIRLVRIGERLHPLFVRMDGATPGVDPAAELIVDRGRRRASLEPAPKDLLDDFMKHVSGG
jgi:CRISPR-associated protein Cmr1